MVWIPYNGIHRKGKMRLQYQLSNGRGTNVPAGRVDGFLADCLRFGGLPDAPAVLAALEAGYKVRNDKADWYSYCRDGDVADALEATARAQREAYEREQEAKHGAVLTCRNCGQTGRAGNYPFSTNPGSGYCDDCR
jgi:hypothetical protein